MNEVLVLDSGAGDFASVSSGAEIIITEFFTYILWVHKDDARQTSTKINRSNSRSCCCECGQKIISIRKGCPDASSVAVLLLVP